MTQDPNKGPFLGTKWLKLAFWLKLYKFEENFHLFRRQKCPTIFGQNVIILPQWARIKFNKKKSGPKPKTTALWNVQNYHDV